MARPLTVKFEDLKDAKFTVRIDEDDQELSWQETLEARGRDGASDAGLYTAIRLTRRVHERLYETVDEYRETFDFASDLAKSYWLDTMGKKIFNDRNLNSAIYAVQVRNRYGWRQSDDQKQAAPQGEPDTPVDDLGAKHKKQIIKKPEVITGHTTTN
ncbi:MAG: hypothetical protein CVV49_00550 [Spirochaetae bacterium HGW-Spirochaetae-5]|nr:MAG: hypothetical protein CVV49_00550 [Spirochaetae bacterium HGW-Spirochaetae-5]